MKESGGTVLAIEAGKTIFIDPELTLERANKAGIAIVATTDQSLAQMKLKAA